MKIHFVFSVGALLFAAAVVSASAGEPALDFTFQDVYGKPHTLAEFRGKVVLLDFWASWCVPCRKGFPFLNELRARHAAAGFEVVGVTLEEDGDAVARFLRAVPASFLVGRDPSGRGGEVFDVAVMPTSVLIDRDGRILARFEGGTETMHRRIDASVAAALKGEPVMVAAAKPREGPKGNLHAWERGYLADPIMDLNGTVLDRIIKEHIHSSKEAAAGDGGVAGGGCGCN